MAIRSLMRSRSPKSSSTNSKASCLLHPASVAPAEPPLPAGKPTGTPSAVTSSAWFHSGRTNEDSAKVSDKNTYILPQPLDIFH